MTIDKNDLLNSILSSLSRIDYIKPEEIPGIDLYMDQVTTFMDEHLSDSKRHEDDKILTKTMINNYSKNDLLPPPVKKKYSSDHLYVLTFIYYLKNILSISDIQKLINPLTDNFFESDDIPDMEKIYSEIYDMCKSQVSNLSRDVINKTNMAKESFSYVENPEEKNFLELFSLVSLLSFDVYLKKNIIETLIDEYASSQDDGNDSKDKNKDNK